MTDSGKSSTLKSIKSMSNDPIPDSDDSAITFASTDPSALILTMTAEGNLIAGPGLATDEGTRRVFDALAAAFPGIVAGKIAELEKVKAELEDWKMDMALTLDSYNVCRRTHEREMGEAKAEIERLRQVLSDLHVTAHCLAKAGPLSTKTVEDAYRHYMEIAAKAVAGLRKE